MTLEPQINKTGVCVCVCVRMCMQSAETQNCTNIFYPGHQLKVLNMTANKPIYAPLAYTNKETDTKYKCIFQENILL